MNLKNFLFAPIKVCTILVLLLLLLLKLAYHEPEKTINELMIKLLNR